MKGIGRKEFMMKGILRSVNNVTNDFEGAQFVNCISR